MALTKVSTPAIKDEAITLAKLLHGDANSDGKFLRANNGADPTFETVNTDLVSDTSPQLGGDLASNGNDILLADSDKAVFGTGADLKIYHNGSHNYFLSSNGDYVFDTGSTELARLTTTGRLGIGTSSPQQRLHLHTASSSAANMVFSNTTTGSGASDGFVVGLDGAERGQIFNQENTDLIFGTNNLERMRINSSGNVGIGTGTIRLAEQLHVLGNGIVTSSAENTNMGMFGTFGGSDLLVGTFNANNVVVRRGNTNVARFTQNGFIPNGTDTAAANALDDYEEGTCTPSFQPASGSYGYIYRTGHYTRIGDVVHLTASISVNGATNASGEVQITGLPFSVRGVNSTWSGEGGHGVGRWFYAGPNHYCFLVCDNSTDRIRVHKADGTFLNHTNMSTGYNQSQFSFTVTYLTDS